ncbi:MmyB family transcriptional regulator [Kitasatospora mediocidica]|uniref:MmyB family transcriptional regulator n=1 Tax=Kitasatospora mediocidica TaxID=58352 RepID=UPI0005611CCB|nr:hypothetical protein [Kitasatospora mediocidica]
MDRRTEIRDFLTTRRARVTPEQAGLKPSPLEGTRRVPGLRPELWNMLEAMSAVPAYIRNGRLDLLAGNAFARALFAPVFDSPARPVNSARFTFLDPAAAEFYPDWDAVADQNVATLRAEVGRNPYDKALSDLIGELSTRGDTFRQRWARHEVRRHRAGAKRLNHPLVGQLTINYETMELAADEGLSLVVCGVVPGSRDADALNLLASWNATEATRPRCRRCSSSA